MQHIKSASHCQSIFWFCKWWILIKKNSICSFLNYKNLSKKNFTNSENLAHKTNTTDWELKVISYTTSKNTTESIRRCFICQKVSAGSTKSSAAIFSSNLPFAPFVFTLWYLNTCWVHVMHVLNMLWILRVCNISLGVLCALWNSHNMKSYECKMCLGITQFLLENMNGAKGRLRGKNGRSITCVYWLI